MQNDKPNHTPPAGPADDAKTPVRRKRPVVFDAAMDCLPPTASRRL